MADQKGPTLLEARGASCECRAGYGQVEVAKLPFLNPDFELVISGMITNGLIKRADEPTSTIREVAAHIETEPIRWRNGETDRLGNGDGNVTSSILPIHEAAGRVAVCVEHMQNGTCTMYKLGPKK